MKSWLKKGFLALTLATACLVGMQVQPIYAQDAVDNLDSVGEQSGLGNEDIRLVIARFIRIGLSFLGVIAVCVVLYGGFVWMTAGGDPEKVDRAKRILINGGIGLVIILMSWSITTFIMTSILGAVNGTGGSGGSGGSGGGGVGRGGSSSSFEVSGISPEGTQSIRNIQVQIGFTRAVDEESVEGAITVKNDTTGEEVGGTFSVSGKRVTFVPSSPCPAPNEDRYCFEENTPYTVTISEDIESTSGVSLTCSSESCSGSFTSGTLVDTEEPTANMTAPDDNDAIAADSTERVEVQATDDAGVAVADFSVDGGESFESVIAAGEDLTEVVLEALWETTGLTVGESYEVSVTVTDVAGNTDEDAVTVTARPATCFNGVQDGEETDVDCGGDSSSAEYCGACEGGSCTEDADCGGGASCEEGICTDLPQISGISPDNGAVGTFVTISGSGFGNTEGTVTFTAAAGGTIEASLASCADGWEDGEIIVVVPEGAGDGPLSITTSDGDSDATNDDAGELVPDFDVNDTERPSLCAITPDEAQVAEAVVLAGSGFGASRGASTVIFGDDDEAGSYTSWSESSATVTVPSVNEGEYSVFVVVDGVESNTVTLAVERESSVDAPNIVSIDPDEGAVGQYITITGSSFGGSLGSVWFEDEETGDRTQASVDFPDECSEDIWSDTEITVIVPEIATGNYAVSVESRAGDESSPVSFTVIDGEPTPGLCSISPDSGEEGETITLYGDNFGTTEGSVAFAGAVTGTILDWGNTEISVNVPSAAETGSVSAVNSEGEESNSLTFTVGASDASSGTVSAAAYAWSFSSGEIPDVPELIVECSATVISAVPNDRFSDEACVNAQIYAEFTVDMNEGTLDDALTLEKCTASGDRPCSTREAVSGSYSTTARSVTFAPTSNLDVSTTYQVTVSEAAMSADGTALQDEETWTFTTKSDATDCEVERVVVSPDEKTLTAINDTQGFSALPVADCNVLDADDYVWGWEVNESYAAFTAAADCAGGSSPCATVEALAEGTTPVTATEQASTQEGSASLTINFSDPYVTQYFPNCTEACVNATVGATFNVPMDATTVESGASLYTCANELCTSLTEVSGASVGCTLNEDTECVGFTFTLPSPLTPRGYYRVILSGDVASESGVPLIRTNYGDDFSWTFRVREDASVCSVERVAISPSSAQSSEVGDQKVFTAQAYGEADACSVSGQLLDAYSYAWTWEDPIDDENNDEDGATVVAAWMGSGFADTDPSSIAEGCTTSCTSLGSSPYAAVCGDGDLEEEHGEECEDGNVTDGDGCSASCLREGGEAVVYACTGSGASCASLSDDATCVEVCSGSVCSVSGGACTADADCTYAASTCEASESGCGDGIIATYEDCDDGNTANGDGCSSSCLAEGSSAIGATCGNGDIAYDATSRAGEECDDGNARNNDGCSSACLNEGTPTLASIGGAICGDGEVDEPYEACDDGNTTDDDGCSSSCLLEGSSLSYTVPSTCNDGTIGTGEECEDGNTANGDGCSSKCIYEGSSAAYAAPSYCGDGVVGTGEIAACEAGASGDGVIDPVQAAYIADTAVFEVNEETGEAVATIRSTESTSTFTAEASWTLFCAATTDADCSDPSAQGVGTGNCCMDRPTVTLSPTGGDVCRNAALYGIFTQPMDTDDFVYEKTVDGEDADEDGVADSTSEETSYRMYAALDLSTTSDGVCPDTHTTLVQAPTGFFARMWNAIKSLVLGRNVLATAGDCILPITGYTQQGQTDSETGVTTFRVYMQASELMVAGATYTLVVEGDADITDGDAEGAVSRYGVSINGDTQETFTVGTEICAVEAVAVTDTDTENPGSFSSLDESHTFTATAISYVSGSAQEIAPIAGVYDWTWSSWETDDETILEVTQDTADLDSATVSPAGENGEANVTATLTIENNTVGIETDDEISGYEAVTALLCENPWPAIEYYPWTDSAEGEAVGAEEGIGWMNFSLGYCKDEGNTADENLPELTVISPDDTQDDAILKEYLFQVQGTSDAIGVRIASNEEYLSPLAWYRAQGFEGDPSETTIDGFPAVEDGRTTYIAAPNLDEAGNYLYSNMYIISYNNDAGDDAIAIYEQIIENLSFATNVSSVGYCTDGTSYGDMCASDLDCVATGQSCADIKGKIARDTHRLADMTDLRTSIEEYGEDNGYCSETTSQICAADDDCPGSETCQPGVPTLASGTFVRSLASSVWGSWNDILSGALDEDAAEDPLNAYMSCGEDPYGDYDANTCVDQARGQYLCPEGSFAYHYRAYGSDIAFIAADLEYPNADWYYPIDEDGTDDGISITIGNSSGFADGFATAAFCDGTTEYGGSQVCGDGLLSATEYCEVGQAGGVSNACDSDGDETDDGYISQICNSTCTAFEDNPSATCTPASCGNGIVEGVEACDDGAANGRYGYCGSDCTMTTATYCGDGVLSGGEQCDCGDADVFSSVPASGRAYGASGVGTCTAFNGSYTASPNASCAWDCSGPPAYCGDGEITGSEQCDGEDDTWGGQLCSGGSDDGDPCSTGSDCASGVCGGSGVYASCATGYTRVMPCDDDAGATCQYIGNWTSLTCTEIGSCGDGVVDPDEQCDDGNSDSTDSCTAQCTTNVCGDGYLYSGEEECDEGTGNGGGCDAGYGSTCSACTTSCRQVVSSGAFCGDGVTNGSEFCDGSDIPYRYYDNATGQILGACSASQAGQVSPTNSAYTCRRLGVCNGGPENGEYCTGSSIRFESSIETDRNYCDYNGITAVSCVFPTCADNCMSSCPFTETTGSLLMTPNLPGSADSSTVDLYSYSSSSTSDLPNAATIVMPACNVAGTLTGTIDMSDVDLPDAYVVFVTDRSGSMGNALGSDTRMGVAKDVLASAIEELFDGLGEDMNIGLIGYSTHSGTGMCSDNGESCSEDSDCGGSATCDDELGFLGIDDEQTLLDRVDLYTEAGNTYTGMALEDAKELLDDIDDDGNVRKIVVLLSDGAPTDSPTSAANAIKNEVLDNGANWELYTVALTTSSTLISDMNEWSSNDGSSMHENGIDYSYSGSTVAQIEEAYDSIIDSILGITVGVISSGASGAELTSTVVTQGNNISLPWPENFECDPTSDQEVPIQLTFLGEGTINLSNLRIEYCAP
jgi:cysteine-rich repeat protein